MTAGQPSESEALGWLDRLIRGARRALRSGWVLAGALISLAIFCAAVTATALLDLAAPLGTFLRLLALGLIVAPTGWALAQGVVRPLARRLPAASVARRIEGRLPGMNDRLVTGVELAADGAARRQSPAFFRRLLDEVWERAKGFRPEMLRDVASIRRAGILGGAAVIALAAAWITFADRLPTAMARIFRPFADIPPATGVAFDVKPGDASLIVGDPVKFEAEVTRGAPEQLRLQVFTPDGESWHDLAREGAGPRWGITLAGMTQPLSYRVHGGGTWSRLHRIAMVERPVIAGARATRIDPGYLGKAPYPQDGLAVKGVAGSTVALEVEAKGEVAGGEIELLQPTSESVDRPESERSERIWFQERVPPGSHPHSIWIWDYKLLARPAHTDEARSGHHWHRFTDDPHGFPVGADDTLFVYAYVYPREEPLAILVRWHDGENWDHRAYWGGNQIGGGKEDTPTRRRMGPVPESGRWVRLEVPAEAVGVAGRTLRGMSFEVFEGHVDWHRVGVIPSKTVTLAGQRVIEKFPLAPPAGGKAAWTGAFPLDRDGAYRVVLRNSLGIESAPMQEAKLTALADLPPTIALEHPADDVELSEPRKVPLTIAAIDDLGIEEIILSVMEPSGAFVGTPIATYPGLTTRARFEHTFDLPAKKLKEYQTVRYRLSVRDKKGQAAHTRDYEIRINPKGNGADKALAGLDRRQERLRERVQALAKRQGEINEATKKAAADHEEMLEEIREAADPREPLKRPEISREAEQLRREVGQAADTQARARHEAEEVARELQQLLEDAERQALMPEAMAEALRDSGRLLKADVADPMRQLAEAMQRGRDPNQALPDPGAMNEAGEEVREGLDAIDRRLGNLDRALDGLKDDPAKAAEQMARENLQSDAERAAKELSQLEKSFEELDKRMEQLEENEKEILKAVPEVPDRMLAELNDVQEKVSAEADQAMAEVDRLMEVGSIRMGEGEEPPDPAEGSREGSKSGQPKPAPGEGQRGKPAPKGERGEPGDGGEQSPPGNEAREPAGEGAGEGQPKPGRQGEGGGEPSKEQGTPQPAAYRRGIAEQGEETREQLKEGRDRLKPDREALEKLQEQMEKVAKGEMEAPEAKQAMQSRPLRRAMEMAARAGEGKPGSNPSRLAHGGTAPPKSPSLSEQGNLEGKPATISAMESQLSELDPGARAALLKMQPQLRDELLKGMNEQAPEGYDGFIREYFRRLTSAQDPR